MTTMVTARNFTAGNKTINSTSDDGGVEWRTEEKGESALSHLAAVLQMSPWTVATLCCLAYTLIMLLIMAVILGSKRAFSTTRIRTTVASSIFAISTMASSLDNDELLRSQQHCLFYEQQMYFFDKSLLLFFGLYFLEVQLLDSYMLKKACDL